MVRDIDLVVFGATGDIGVVGCCYLFFQGKRLGINSWAPAARNSGKLKNDVLDRLAKVGTPGQDGLLPAEPIEADAQDYASLVKMCARTNCVLACAGPYSWYGEGVVKACVEAGTNYVDVTGEIPWVETMQRKYGLQAEKRGVSIVNCAGYDSIPPDLATFLAAKAVESADDHLQRFEAFCGAWGGAMPTGTLNTVLDGVQKGKQRVLRLATCGVLGTDGKVQGKTEKEVSLLDGERKEGKFVPLVERRNLNHNLFWTMFPAYSKLAGQFCLPHFMAPINLHTVHHTAAREGYGGLEYRERWGLPPQLAGPLGLYGLLPTFLGVTSAILFGLFVPLPGFSTVVLKLRDLFNPPLQQHVRDLLFSGFKSTGRTFVDGYGMSRNGRTVSVKMQSEYDAGLGFTMLAACTVAAQVAQRSGTSAQAKPGFNSAVVALGGEALADALRSSGVDIQVNVSSSSKL